MLELDFSKELFEVVEQENQKLKGMVSDLEKEKEHVRVQKFPKDAIILDIPNEAELYDGEYKNVVYQALVDALSALPDEKSSPNRSRDLLNGIIEANKIKKESLPKAKFLEGLRKVNTADSLEKFLIANGFVKGAENGHVKWRYKNDPRYIIVVSKSPSDYRSYKNDGSTARHILF